MTKFKVLTTTNEKVEMEVHYGVGRDAMASGVAEALTDTDFRAVRVWSEDFKYMYTVEYDYVGRYWAEVSILRGGDVLARLQYRDE